MERRAIGAADEGAQSSDRDRHNNVKHFTNCQICAPAARVHGSNFTVQGSRAETWTVNLDPPGTLERWNAGTLEPRNPGTLEPWNPGTLEPWNPGTLEPW